MENHPYQNYQYQAEDELNNMYPIHGASSSSYTPPAEQPPYYDYSNESYVDTPPVRENASDNRSSRSIRREKSRRNSVLGYEVIHHPGLNVLAGLNRIEIRQKVEALEIMAGWETQNEYVVLEPDANGQCRGRGRRIFRLMERSSTMSRIYLGTKRDMQVYMLPMSGRHDSVLVLDRPWRLWGKRATVYGPSGIDGPPIAKLKRSGGYKRLSPTYHISILTPDPDKSRRREIFTLSANTVYPRNFTIHRGGETLLDSNGKKATIKKKWSGIVKEFFTDADNFVINFPTGATVTEKALLIACGLFIDLCFYETSPQQ